jgi:hypothetical protein
MANSIISVFAAELLKRISEEGEAGEEKAMHEGMHG